MASSTIKYNGPRISVENRTVTTDSGGNFFVSNKYNILAVYVVNVTGERYVRIHTYLTDVYGRLFDGSGQIQPNTEVTVQVISII